MSELNFQDCSGLARFSAVASPNPIGLIVLGTDLTSEPDYRRAVPSEAATVYTTRIEFENPTNRVNLLKLADRIPPALEHILPGMPLSAVVFSCTAASALFGFDKVASLIHSVKPGAACITPVDSAIDAFRSKGISRISVLTPYIDELNTVFSNYFRDHGLDVVKFTRFGLDSDVDIARLDPDCIIEALKVADHEDAEGIFVSCTGLRALQILDRAEAATGKVIVSSNQATIRSVLKAVEYRQEIVGFGSALQHKK